VVAEFAWNWLDRAIVSQSRVTKQTKNFRDDEGNVWFRFTPMYLEAQMQRLDFTRNQLSRAVRSAGARDDKYGNSESRVSLLKMDIASMSKLEALANGDEVCPANSPISSPPKVIFKK
jgi:hypothetical protein